MRLGVNLVANLFGRGWSAALNLLLVPVYVRILGVEAYGVVGLFSVALALMIVFDMGLSAAVTREFAKEREPEHQWVHDMSATAAALFWVVAVGVCVTGFFARDFVATRWLSAEVLSADALRAAVVGLAAAVAAAWPSTFYKAALMGLGRHAPMNLAIGVGATVRAGLSLALIWREPTLERFFVGQVAGFVVMNVWLAWLLRTGLGPAPGRRRIGWHAIQPIAGFSGQMAVLSLVTLGLTQLDKVILSRVLPLAEFGAYSVAWTAAAGLYALVNPFFGAIYPQLSRELHAGRPAALALTLDLGSRALGALVWPATMVLAWFAEPVLIAWTGDVGLAETAAPLLRILVVGVALNAAMNPPYALMLAAARVRFLLFQNAVALTLTLPSLLLFTPRFGAAAAAAVWLALNSGYVLFAAPLMFRGSAPESGWVWFRGAVLAPAAVAGAACALLSAVLTVGASWPRLLGVGFVVALTVAAAAWLLPGPWKRRARELGWRQALRP